MIASAFQRVCVFLVGTSVALANDEGWIAKMRTVSELRMLRTRGVDADGDVLGQRRPLDIALSIVSRQAGYLGIASGVVIAVMLLSRYLAG